MITKETMDVLRRDIDLHLTMVGVKHGLKLQLGGGTYQLSGEGARFRLDITDLTGPTGAQNVDELAFKQRAVWFGLKPDWLHRVFTDEVTGDQYEIIGLRPRRRKYPVVVKNMTSGKNYIFQAIRVSSSMKFIQS